MSRLIAQGLLSDWMLRTFMVLIAAWGSISLLVWWPERSADAMPRLAALMLGVLLLGILVTQPLLRYVALR